MLGLFLTTRQPMRGLVDDVLALEGHDGVLSITLAHGFVRSDMPDAGASVLVVTDGDPVQAESLARSLGERFFALREASTSGLLSIDDCLDAAAAAPPGAVVIADGSDNPGGGAPGDSTFLLRRMLERGIGDAALAMLWDPIAVRTAQDAGVGAVLDLRIGGKLGPMSGDPLDVRARVLAVAEEARQPTWSDTQRRPFGPAAAIAVDGVEIVLASRRIQTFAPECFTEVGIDPWAKRLLIVKSNQHFYARFAPFASAVLYCDAPGSLMNDVRPVHYTRVRRPIWPLEPLERPW
jgi:microcystin degradation protein MlrC